MKEIKAFIQRCRVNKVVDALEKAGAPGITIVEIHPVGYGYEPDYFEFGHDFNDAFKRYRQLSIVKLEMVAADKDTERFVKLIQQECSTGCPGDGRIFVADIDTAVRIRDGARGEESL